MHLIENTERFMMNNVDNATNTVTSYAKLSSLDSGKTEPRNGKTQNNRTVNYSDCSTKLQAQDNKVDVIKDKTKKKFSANTNSILSSYPQFKCLEMKSTGETFRIAICDLYYALLLKNCDPFHDNNNALQQYILQKKNQNIFCEVLKTARFGNNILTNDQLREMLLFLIGLLCCYMIGNPRQSSLDTDYSKVVFDLLYEKALNIKSKCFPLEFYEAIASRPSKETYFGLEILLQAPKFIDFDKLNNAINSLLQSNNHAGNKLEILYTILSKKLTISLDLDALSHILSLQVNCNSERVIDIIGLLFQNNIPLDDCQLNKVIYSALEYSSPKKAKALNVLLELDSDLYHSLISERCYKTINKCGFDLTQLGDMSNIFDDDNAQSAICMALKIPTSSAQKILNTLCTLGFNSNKTQITKAKTFVTEHLTSYSGDSLESFHKKGGMLDFESADNNTLMNKTNVAKPDINCDTTNLHNPPGDVDCSEPSMFQKTQEKTQELSNSNCSIM